MSISHAAEPPELEEYEPEEDRYDDSGVVRYDREYFLTHVFDAKPGEHLTILGPTGSGKTYLGYQLMDVTTTPEVPGVVLVMKPRDKTVTKWSKTVGYLIVRSWPPTVSPWKPKKPRGWVVWPKHTFVPERDEQILHDVFRRTLLDCYRKGNKFLFGDEVYSLAEELNLDKELITLWSKGRSMECALWVASQKPTHIPLWAYSQAEHLFLAFDPDKRARDRFSEIGGVDPEFVKHTVMRLKKYEWLYIRREDGAMCIVEA